jgi:uncharacterized protein YeaO (DUF488 family)
VSPDAPAFEVRRIYHDDASDGGYRVLVDRLWPRGLKKDDASYDEWCKDVAPSTELRRWYGHDPRRFDEFAARYRGELNKPPASDSVEHLLEMAHGHGALVILTATADVEHSGAQVLQCYLQSKDRR